MNLYEAKTLLLGKGGVAAPSRKMARRHLVWRGRGGSSKLPLESIRRLNEPPRLRPAKVASRHFIDGRSHPSFAKEWNSGSFCFPRLLQIVAGSGSLNFEFPTSNADFPFSQFAMSRLLGDEGSEPLVPPNHSLFFRPHHALIFLRDRRQTFITELLHAPPPLG